jgi:hypothetical protein
MPDETKIEATCRTCQYGNPGIRTFGGELGRFVPKQIKDEDWEQIRTVVRCQRWPVYGIHWPTDWCGEHAQARAPDLARPSSGRQRRVETLEVHGSRPSEIRGKEE